MPVNPETQNPTGSKHPKRQKNPKVKTPPSPVLSDEERAQATAPKARKRVKRQVAKTQARDAAVDEAVVLANRAIKANKRARKAAKAPPVTIGAITTKKGDVVSAAIAQKSRQRQAKSARIERQSEAYDAEHYAGGLVDLIDHDLGKSVRSTVFGDASPSVGNVALTLAPIPAVKGASLVRGLVRGEKGLKTAARGAKAAEQIAKARKVRKAERATARAAQSTKLAKARATGKGLSSQAKKRLTKVEAKAAARRTAHRSADRALRSATSPIVAGASVAPGDVGDKTRAFVEGTATANPIKSAQSTLEAVPALFTAGASLAGAGYRTAKTGNPDYITEAVKTMGKGAVDVVKPYVSGDPEKVRKANEETGYILAPLLPRGVASRPVRVVGRGAKAATKRVVRPATERTAVRRAASGKTAPSKPQRAAQIVAGAKKRKDVAVTMARHRGPQVRLAQDVATTIERASQKSKGARSFHNLSGPEAGGAAAILARHGIGPGAKDPIARLNDVLRKTDNPHNEMVNLTNTVEWLKRNPEVLKDKHFWATVKEFHKGTEPLETSPRAKFAAQGDVAGVTRPEHAVPHAARGLTKARTREGAFKDLERRRKAAQKATQEARIAEAQARVLPKAAKSKLTFSRRGDAVGPEYHETIYARNAKGETVGHLSYSYLDGQNWVQMVEVDPKYRRQGVATELLGELRRGDPEAKVTFSSTTPDGTKWLATANRRGGLVERGLAKRAEAKRLDAEAKALADALRPFRAKDTWDKALLDEYVGKVRTARHGDLEDPAWLSEKPIKQDPEVPGGGNKPGLVVHTQTGAARKADMVDRSLPAVLRNSIIDPHARTGTARGIRESLIRHKITVGGKQVFTGPELVRLAAKGKIDLTRVKAIPSRWWKAPLDDEVFDAVKLHEDTSALLRTELQDLSAAKGTKYVLTPNEVAHELVDQLAPEAGRWEKFIGTTAGIGSRVVLYSPAWVAAQVVNESSQLIADAGARGVIGAAADMVRLHHSNPEAYQALLRQTGDPSPSAHPVSPRTNATANEYLDISNLGQAARKTPVGRFLYEFGHLRTFSNVDRWKSTRIKAMAVLAKNNRDFGQFTKGLSRTLNGMEEISAKLAKMSRPERHAYILKDGPLMRRQLDHMDDMMGNWDAFTRYERTFGPLTAFYPYLRMSLRWTFHTFPKGHPIKAQIFYLLAQQNKQQLEKLLGSEPSFIQGAYPVLYDEKGKADALMPGGARFGAPGSNTLVEAMGEGNVVGALRLLNPTLSTGLFSITGLNPFTGVQDVKPGTAEWGMHALETLLSTFPPARAIGLSTLGEKSDAAKVFDALDPNRALRSAINPFIPLSGERARMQQTLSDALEAVSNEPEYGDLIDAITAKDKTRVRELAKAVDLAADARKVLEQFLPSSKAEEKAVSRAYEIKSDGTKALGKKAQTSTDTTTTGWYSDSTPDASTSSASKGGWYK